MKKTINIIIGLFSWILIGFFVVTIGMTLLSNFDLLRGYRSFLVQSGSMEPTIMMGDVVITTQSKQYLERDVVTFKDKDQRTVTHRIIESKETSNGTVLVTKGDANQTKDRDEISPSQILGKVSLVIPKMGFVIAFSRTPLGLIILVIIPAGIIIFDEIRDLLRASKKNKNIDNTIKKEELESE